MQVALFSGGKNKPAETGLNKIDKMSLYFSPLGTAGTDLKQTELLLMAVCNCFMTNLLDLAMSRGVIENIAGLKMNVSEEASDTGEEIKGITIYLAVEIERESLDDCSKLISSAMQCDIWNSLDTPIELVVKYYWGKESK